MHAVEPSVRPRRSGRSKRVWIRGAVAAGATIAAAAIPIATALGTSPAEYQQTNLISDIPGVARITDPNLVNPWGLAATSKSPLWVSDNNSGVSTLYTGGVNGSIAVVSSLVVTIPAGNPTGIVTNQTPGFVVTTTLGSAPANFIFDSESGVLSAWSGKVSGTMADFEFGSRRAVYKGLAMATVGSSTYLYATNFRKARIDVFNDQFQLVKWRGAFRDRMIPAGFAPFNVQLLNGFLYVTYAQQDAAKHDDVPGPGAGFVDVYSTSGVLEQRLISGGDLNAPWGLVIAPSTFGAFAGDLLVGNFGDGTIHAYNPSTGTEVGQLMNTDGNPIKIDSLWALQFGNGTFASPQTLVFTAGIGAEDHGLLGEIAPAS